MDVRGNILTPLQYGCKSRGRQAGNSFLLRDIRPYVFVQRLVAIDAYHDAICLNADIHSDGIFLSEVQKLYVRVRE